MNESTHAPSDIRSPSGRAIARTSSLPETGETELGSTPDSQPEQMAKVSAEKVTVRYNGEAALHGITLDIAAKSVTALIGPSGCGKSTFLRVLNRMNDLIEAATTEGTVLLDGLNIYADGVDVVELRRRVGMVFQKSVPFPKSIYENIAYGPRLAGLRNRQTLDEIVHRALNMSALWDEVKDRLNESALGLSGGQQQRLCIARALATSPEVILMDEPASALDPISTGRIEDLIVELKEQYTIVIVTHNMQQAARISDRTAFFYQGQLIEMNDTKTIFTCPSEKQTEDYVTGKFG